MTGGRSVGDWARGARRISERGQWTAAAVAVGLAASLHASPAKADPLNCDLAGYRPQPGLSAAVADDVLTVDWSGAGQGEQVRLRFAVQAGAPVIRELAVRGQGGGWTTVMADVAPEFRVVTALRRITNQQLTPLRRMGREITQSIIDEEKWEAFWDAPLRTGPASLADSHLGTMPPRDGIGTQPGLPRRPEEVRRASAAYAVRSCTVKTNGARLEIAFPGVQLGVFSGSLQYSVYRGANLIRQEVIAKTEEPSVAYKYDAGLKGLPIAPDARVAWRNVAGAWQDHRLGGGVNADPVEVEASNRLIAAENRAGSVALFPPPHNFFWAREITTNLGYNFYRKDGPTSFSIGVRQAESEADPGQAGRGRADFRENFALYSARPGTWQRMAVYILADAKPAPATIDAALAYTRGDRYAALPGYKVMLAHVHGYFVKRLAELGVSIDSKPGDFEAVRAAGVNIFAPIDGGAGGVGKPPTPDQYVENLSKIYEIARRHSDKDFLVMPNLEVTEGELPALVEALGGHWDLQMPRPVFYSQGRAAGQPLVESHPKVGQVYRLGGAEDVGEMMRREGIIAFMPHPRSKGSTGYPDAIKDTPRFRDASFRGIGWRWGMGLDGSEKRLCDERCLTTLDDMNNWVADLPTPPKYIQAISEFYQQSPGDEIYSHTPVNYLRLDKTPEPGDWAPVVDAMRRGDFFVTSGEVLITNYAVHGTGRARTVAADVQWTFPLEFVEVVWGDGKTTGRRMVSATDLPPFGSKRFEIPFDPTGKKWVRFAVWDSAGNGAMVQPVKLPDAVAPPARAP
jgi:hypothetical protein